MDIKECYAQIGGDYDEVLSRLPGEKFIKMFLDKFLKDQSFSNLEKAFKEKNSEEAFRAAHSIKGICQNLGFRRLEQSSGALTELLRTGSFEGSEDLFAQVSRDYHTVVEGIRGLDI